MKPKAPYSLRGLRTFCAAAKHEAFAAAAKELFITPSAVSHQIRSLEDELGLELFARGANELRLTPVGRGMYEELRPLIDKIEQTVGSYRKRAPGSSVRMSVQPFFASEFFVPRLGEFTARHPDIDIQVAASDESAATHAPDADLSIRLFRAPPDGVDSRLLFPLRLVPAGSAAMAERLQVSAGRIVSDFPIVIHDSYPKAWEQWAESAGIAVPEDGKVTRLDSMIAVVRAVEQGIGAALVPIPITDQWFRQGTITRLFEHELVADVSYFLLWRPEATERRDIRLLHDWILERCCETC